MLFSKAKECVPDRGAGTFRSSSGLGAICVQVFVPVTQNDSLGQVTYVGQTNKAHPFAGCGQLLQTNR